MSSPNFVFGTEISRKQIIREGWLVGVWDAVISKSLESREIVRNTDLSRSLSYEKIELSFLFLFSIIKNFRENSISLLDLWDFEK